MWLHKNGDKRWVREVRFTRGKISWSPKASASGWTEVFWSRLDSKRGKKHGQCLIVTWDRWARNAELVEDSPQGCDCDPDGKYTCNGQGTC